MAQRGDAQAYSALLGECRNWLARYYRRRVAPDDLDDLVQETLVSLHRKRASYDPTLPFLPWLAAIARYRWVDHLRAISRRKSDALEDDVPIDSGESATLARLSLERLFAQLPDGQARAIELVKVQGLTVAEASETCGQSASLVKVNIHRGLRKLAALIEKD
jgi:RNA polymerase sigma factor (sigma-70 family)